MGVVESTLRMAVIMGGTPLGAPIVGWLADHAGPRWAMMVAAASGLIAATVAARLIVHERRRQASAG